MLQSSMSMSDERGVLKGRVWFTGGAGRWVHSRWHTVTIVCCVIGMGFGVTQPAIAIADISVNTEHRKVCAK